MANKNGNSDNKNIFDKDISLLFDEELEQARNERQQRIERHVKSAEAQSRSASKDKFYERVLSAFEKVEAETHKTGETCYDIAAALENLLLKSEPSLHRGADIFGMLCALIKRDEERFINAAPQPRQEIVMGHIYGSLRSSAESFCAQRLKEQIDENNLPKSLVHLIDYKKRISEDRFSFEFETNQLKFTESCIVHAATLLINAIERVIDLEANEIAINKRLELKKQLGIAEAEEKTKEKRSSGGSQYQNLLAIHYLFKYLKTKDNKRAKARFAAFLTGFSENTLYNDSFNIHAKQDENGVKWEKDVELVKSFFTELGLNEIVRMVDNDLSSL